MAIANFTLKSFSVLIKISFLKKKFKKQVLMALTDKYWRMGVSFEIQNKFNQPWDYLYFVMLSLLIKVCYEKHCNFFGTLILEFDDSVELS